jgi:hypothetical protein
MKAEKWSPLFVFRTKVIYVDENQWQIARCLKT